MMHRSLRLGLALCALLTAPLAAQTRLLRFPDLHGDLVAFCYASDLWLAPASGGDARRLTSSPGLELFPKFSPCGKWIAFTGQYDGDEQVYVIPTSGGTPKKLTHYPARGPLPPRWGYDNQVYGWSVDGEQVLFRSMRDGWDLTDTRLWLVPVKGGLPQPLAMPVSGGGDLSPDGKKVVYSPLTRDFRSWKRYQGGWAQDLFVFDLEAKTSRQITDHVRTDRDPMWIGERVYYASDRDGKLNLYYHDLQDGDTVQVTHEKTSDVRWPSKADNGRIVYELLGELHILETAKHTVRKLEIRVPDDGVHTRPERLDVSDQIRDYGLSPKGERALFSARGDIFTAPIEHGSARNLTRSTDVHERDPVWSPCGKKVLFISDRGGEEQLWWIDQDGSGEPEALTEGHAARLYGPEFSPDGKHVAYSDKDGKLHVLTLADRSRVEIADEKSGLLRDFSWSPHGGWLAYSLSEESGLRSLWIWSARDKKARKITGEMFDERSPTWDPDGQYLYYLSRREFAPLISGLEWNYAGTKDTGIFCLALTKKAPHPFPPRSDEVTVEDEKDEKKDQDEEKKPDQGDGKKDDAGKKEKHLEIDFEGLAARAVRVPVPADNYGGLSAAAKGKLFFFKTGPFFYGRSSGVRPSLHVYDLKERELKTMAEGARGYAFSADGKHLLLRKGRSFSLHAPRAGDKGKKVNPSGFVYDRVPHEEWAQIFDEVWRRFRDFFYVENMHGYDWPALREQYRPLLRHVAHRSDLNYVISEMIAELNVSHAYVTGGDWDAPRRVPVALPGCRFELDPKAERYRIAAIFEGQNEEARYRAPLREVGVDARVGDYVLAIDGQELRGDDNPYRLLRGLSGRPVTMTLNDAPETEGAREVTFRPRTSETDLIYLAWVEGNRQRVLAATNGRCGYIHVPDMGGDGIAAFIKGFYPQIRKDGLVIDVRNNGGGNVSQMLIERLRRVLLSAEFARTNERTDTYPSHVFTGHLVCLLNENSASDGDIFPAMFKEAGLGPLIGKRSWGGIIGITNRGPLLDSGGVNVPEFGNASREGKWIIEGYGVDPDIVVEQDPAAVLRGEDPQLQRGIAELMKRIEAEPRGLPERPADPVRTK